MCCCCGNNKVQFSSTTSILALSLESAGCLLDFFAICPKLKNYCASCWLAGVGYSVEDKLQPRTLSMVLPLSSLAFHSVPSFLPALAFSCLTLQFHSYITLVCLILLYECCKAIFSWVDGKRVCELHDSSLWLYKRDSIHAALV